MIEKMNKSKRWSVSWLARVVVLLIVAFCLLSYSSVFVNASERMDGASFRVKNRSTAYISGETASSTEEEETSPAEQNRGTAYHVTANTAKVRSGPGYGYSVITTLKKGNIIYVSSIDNGWARFTYLSQPAYIRSSQIAKH